MPIRLAPKQGFAEVPDDVVEKIKELRAQRARQISGRLNEIKLEIAQNPNGYRIRQLAAEAEQLKASFSLLKRTGGGSVRDGARRGGLSDIMMRMRRLDYQKFYLKSRQGAMDRQQDWIIGLTKPLMAEITYSHRGHGGHMRGGAKYDMGPYFIAVLCQDIGTHHTTFHLMPERNPTTMARHMHHHVSSNNRNSNPLDWNPRNCLGSFGGAVQGSFLNADIPELFRMLYIFTKTLNPSSPLLSLSQLPHIKEVTDE